MVRLAVLVTPPQVAEITAVVGLETPVVEIVNLTEVAPAGTVTLTGTVADAEELLRLTTAPEGPAGPVRTTPLPAEEVPPTIVVGASEMTATETGLMVRLAVRVTPP